MTKEEAFPTSELEETEQGKEEKTGPGKEQQPAGGYDPTPVPVRPPGNTLRITFHRAQNLPFADFRTLSSNPYLIATLKPELPKRHKQDPDLLFRTPTIQRSKNPEWDAVWTVAHVPSAGFHLKIRVYDEDRSDHDDRLGNVSIQVNDLSVEWSGIREQSYSIKKRMASRRAYFVRGCAAILSREVKMDGKLDISVECLGESEGNGGRAYTIGPSYWTRHHSPLIGRLAGTKDRNEEQQGERETQRYNFQAIKMQLAGPVPPELYHRYVEFKPFVPAMFDARSPRGWILNRALHHQHRQVYNYDSSTLYGYFQQPCIDMTKQFLDFVHYDDGGRIFTYVLTLDGQWRFTETGKEFGIDLLSKHTMHSDASVYIAFSGEFFIRRLNKPEQRQCEVTAHRKGSNVGDHDDDIRPDAEPSTSSPKTTVSAKSSTSDPDIPFISGDPSDYEMVIDNDSGTYRPSAECLSALQQYMGKSLPGLRILTLDCQSDAEKMEEWKDEQRRRKRDMGGQVQYLQRNSTSSSVSSSDEEELDAMGRLHTGGQENGNREDKLKQGYHDRMATVKPGVDMATQDVKRTIGINGRRTQTDQTGEKGSSYRAKGGIVGEDGPVRMREKEAKLEKEQQKKMRHSRQESSQGPPDARQALSADRKADNRESGAKQ